MMHPSSAADQYFRTQVRSSAPLELVVLLYDAALRSTAVAREAMLTENIPARRTALSKAMAIVNELQSVLDMERGGSIASELDRLYTWINGRLVDAVVKQDAKPIDEVRRVLETLRSAWHTIATTPPAAVVAAATRGAGAPAGVGARP
jgi:flagellar protein FliS